MATANWNTLNAFQTEEIDRRFWLISRRVFIVFVVFSIVIPLLPVFELTREKQQEVPERVARVLVEKRQQIQKPKPPVPMPQPEKKKEVPQTKETPVRKKKVEKPVPRVSTKERVSKVGLLAMRNDLAALREAPELKRITNPNRQLDSAGSNRAIKESKPVTRKVVKGSAGVSTKNLSRETSRTQLSERELTKVDSKLAEQTERNQKGDARVAMRTIEDIQLVLERHKGSFNILYTKQLRKNPRLRGKVLFEIIIAPSGKVISCKVIESELKDPSLERKFVLKFKSIDFGEEDVENTIINYPLDFFPS